MNDPVLVDICNGVRVMHGGPAHREFVRLRGIEKAALALMAKDQGGFTNVRDWEIQYNYLRAQLGLDPIEVDGWTSASSK